VGSRGHRTQATSSTVLGQALRIALVQAADGRLAASSLHQGGSFLATSPDNGD